MKIDAVAVTSSDMERSIAFYSAVGFDFTGADPAANHLEPATPDGACRLMIDRADFMERLSGMAPRPASHAGFALLCDTPAEVDARVEAVRTAGFVVVTEPWDAFWGQRYASVADPDGYLVDLFAPLAG
ncbi:VOC family protein [Roseisalinus antarcticus]|uniref:Glyoxalase-like domain protein n=1 Tax=Roseisalinus antarcticus TaxID=254357 RepID=A0A1Y5RZC1_9RHOB|nr:VOC family protein [Roseisalinus antarcticus]SLN28449.1 Glyoxalase-like domain protein [Roseisalinus antarcticus]